MAFEEEQIRDFYESYTDIPSYDQLAMELGVDVGVVLSRSIVAVNATRAVKQAATLHAMRRRFLSLIVFLPGLRPFSINKS